MVRRYSPTSENIQPKQKQMNSQTAIVIYSPSMVNPMIAFKHWNRKAIIAAIVQRRNRPTY